MHHIKLVRVRKDLKKLIWAPAFSAALLFVWSLGAATPALAIPVFANGQGGVRCGLCHTAVPDLNSYGRYVLMTNFSRGLNKHLQVMQNRTLPVALEATANASNVSDPTLPALHSALVQFLSGGFVGPEVSYFASVPVVTGGFPADAIDQVWVAYNGFSHGAGSLQIGKFPTPVFAPWTSQSLSLSGYGVASLPVGLNDSTLADNRWGASYTQLGHLGWIGNLSYVSGGGPVERAFSSEGKGTAWTGSVQYLSPESRWSGGIAGLSGFYPLPSGAHDRYTRTAALASYNGGRYEITGIGVVGHDANPNDGSTAAADSRGLSLETIYALRPWMHADLRYEHTDDGLGNSAVNYIAAGALSIRPNVVLTVEDVASVGKLPVLKYQLLWAGPWYRNRFPEGSVPPRVPSSAALASPPTASPPVASAPPMSGMPMPASPTPLPVATSAPVTPVIDDRTLANGRSIYFTGTDAEGARIATAAKSRIYQSCAVCHGPDGTGGVLLADGAISAKLGSHAHMLDTMNSMGPMKPKVPWTVALFERAISTGFDENGDPLSPVMPRWEMSKRDLHEIAVYIFTQIR